MTLPLEMKDLQELGLDHIIDARAAIVAVVLPSGKYDVSYMGQPFDLTHLSHEINARLCKQIVKEIKRVPAPADLGMH